ncbi:MAG: prepilin-type N-terminal cleavage/methylation domain-containing protein [Candidatus Gastranaerophilales bacterium]|nr:prepilin-type N-terminal cleavage/methylation domain-containing protein [Candidatus Gastranaerophilales bacterium]
MKNNMNKQAFSLVEMLIALIAISCITVALAPVITKKIKANAVTIIYSQKENKYTISKEFTTPCDHEFIVPAGVYYMEITIF